MKRREEEIRLNHYGMDTKRRIEEQEEEKKRKESYLPELLESSFLLVGEIPNDAIVCNGKVLEWNGWEWIGLPSTTPRRRTSVTR